MMSAKSASAKREEFLKKCEDGNYIRDHKLLNGDVYIYECMDLNPSIYVVKDFLEHYPIECFRSESEAVNFCKHLELKLFTTSKKDIITQGDQI